MEPVEQPAGMAGGTGIVCGVTNHQGGHPDATGTGRPVGAGIVVAPLAQPATQGVETGQGHRTVVYGSRVAQITGPRGALIGVLLRVQPTDVAHGAVDDKAVFLVGQAAVSKIRQFLFHPAGNAPVAVDLGLAEPGHERLAVGRLVGAVRMINIQLPVPLLRIAFIQHGRVQPFGHGNSPGHMGGEQHDAVCGDQFPGRQVVGVSRRGVGDLRIFRFRLVKQTQGAAAGPARQYHCFKTQPLFGITHAGAKIGHHFLHQQGAIGAPVAAVAIDHRHPGFRQRRHHGQVGATAHRVHENHHRLAGPAFRCQQVGLQGHQIHGARIGVLETGLFTEGDQIGGTVIVLAHCCAALSLGFLIFEKSVLLMSMPRRSRAAAPKLRSFRARVFSVHSLSTR